MHGLTTALLIATSTVAPQTLSLGQVRDADPAVLAARVLPPETPDNIVGGLVRRQWIPGQSYFIRLDEPPAVHSEQLCRRLSHVGGAKAQAANDAPDDTSLDLDPFQPVTFYASTYPKPADVTICRSAEGWISASDDRTAPTLAMLERLTSAMRQAAGNAPLDFTLSCTTEVSYSASGPCPDARAALAALPLDHLLHVGLRNTVYQDEPARNGVRVRYMQPVTNQQWPEAEVSFDASPPDGRSWTVVLKGVDRLEAVEMRRSTIIRH